MAHLRPIPHECYCNFPYRQDIPPFAKLWVPYHRLLMGEVRRSGCREPRRTLPPPPSERAKATFRLAVVSSVLDRPATPTRRPKNYQSNPQSLSRYRRTLLREFCSLLPRYAHLPAPRCLHSRVQYCPSPSPLCVPPPLEQPSCITSCQVHSLKQV